MSLSSDNESIGTTHLRTVEHTSLRHSEKRYSLAVTQQLCRNRSVFNAAFLEQVRQSHSGFTNLLLHGEAVWQVAQTRTAVSQIDNVLAQRVGYRCSQ